MKSMTIRRWLDRLESFVDRFRRTKLTLMDDADLLQLFDESTARPDVSATKLACSSCGQQLTKENVAGFVIRHGERHFFCAQPNCTPTFART